MWSEPTERAHLVNPANHHLIRAGLASDIELAAVAVGQERARVHGGYGLGNPRLRNDLVEVGAFDFFAHDPRKTCKHRVMPVRRSDFSGRVADLERQDGERLRCTLVSAADCCEARSGRQPNGEEGDAKCETQERPCRPASRVRCCMFQVGRSPLLRQLWWGTLGNCRRGEIGVEAHERLGKLPVKSKLVFFRPSAGILPKALRSNLPF